MVLEHVSKAYGDTKAVSDLSLSLHPGEVTVLLGPNGAGKTTTLSMMIGLRKPTAGHVKVFGMDPADRRARVRTGVMLQESGVPDALKVRELIELFGYMYPKPMEFKEVVRLSTLGQKLDARIGELSGGQRQRLYFALAVCGDPDLMFLDEPTVAMDVDSRNEFLEHIQALAERGKTIVLTTHYLAEAERLADRVVVIHRSRLIADGSKDELKALTAGKRVTFRTDEPLTAADFEGLPADRLQLPADTVAEAVRLHSDRPEEVLAALAVRGVRLRDLEVVGADLEEAVQHLIHTATDEVPLKERP